MKALVSLFVLALIAFWVLAFPQTPAKRKAQLQRPVLVGLDRQFAIDAAMGSMAEVQMGELAETHGTSDFVKQFGVMMVKDHGSALDELKPLAASKNIRLPIVLSASMQATYNYLSRLNGAAFDQAYKSKMLKDHQAALTKFKNYSAKGRDSELRAYASKGISMIQKHLQALRSGRLSSALPSAGFSYDRSATLVAGVVQGRHRPS